MKTLFSIYHRLLLNLPTSLSKVMYNIAYHIFNDKRKSDFRKVFSHIKMNNIKGDYFEFGVYRGKSFVMAMKIAESKSMQMMDFYAFDSFEGLPNDEGEVFFKSEFKNPLLKFNTLIVKAGCDIKKVNIIPGFYNESLKKTLPNIKGAAIVHIDCDLYESTKDVLDFIGPFLIEGSIIIFDDWYSFSNRLDAESFGEKKAFNEWALSNCFDVFESEVSKIFIKNR